MKGIKYLAFFIIGSYCIGSSFVPAPSKFKGDCKTIVDSANAFLQTSESAINFRPTKVDKKRNFDLDKWLQKLTFIEFRCLLEKESVPLKSIGFVYAASNYSDSLLKYYSHFLNDTTSVQIISSDGKVSQTMKLGMLLSAIMEQTKSNNESFARQSEIEKKVSTFIMSYSTYSASYIPHSFPEFSVGSENSRIDYFKISHDYELRNNEGDNIRLVSVFVFDKNLKLHVIEKDSTKFISAYPSKIGGWIKEFGRPLTRIDSVTLRLR